MDIKPITSQLLDTEIVLKGILSLFWGLSSSMKAKLEKPKAEWSKYGPLATGFCGWKKWFGRIAEIYQKTLDILPNPSENLRIL